MIKKILSLIFVVASIATFSSCLKSNDIDVTIYDDSAISAFAIVHAKQVKHTLTYNGKSDSTYSVQINPKAYHFAIDQLTKSIYNPDSLPYGTDASKMLVSATAQKQGAILINVPGKENQDNWRIFSDKDTLDLTRPVKIRAFNTDHSVYREYTLHINVHQQSGDEFSWHPMTYSALEQAGERKLISNNGQLFVFAKEDGKTVIYRQQGSGFTRLKPTFSPEAFAHVISFNNLLFILDGQQLKQSANGEQWEDINRASDNQENTGETIALLGASNHNLYAMTTLGIARSNDMGIHWHLETLDTDAQQLPDENWNFVQMPSLVNPQVQNLFVIGTKNNVVKIWRKIEDASNTAGTSSWAYFPTQPQAATTLPALPHLQVVSYDRLLLATGGNLSVFYVSKDQGISWHKDMTYTVTSESQQPSVPFSLHSENNHWLYLSQAHTASVLKGQLSRLSWATSHQN